MKDDYCEATSADEVLGGNVDALAEALQVSLDEQTVPIRLSPIPTTSRVLPIPRVKLGLGRAAMSSAS